MKAINSKFAVLGLATVLITACSDSSDNGGNAGLQMNTNLVGTAVVSQTDAQALAARVHNYKGETTGSAPTTSRAATTSQEVSVPENAKKLSDYVNTAWDFPAGDYVIEENEEVGKDISFNLEGKNIYVKGTFYYSGSYNSKSNITILGTGKLVINGDANPFGTSDIMNYGKIDFGTKNQITFQKTFYDYTDELDLSGKDIQITTNAQLYVAGALKADNIVLNSGAALWNGCSIYCANRLYLTNGTSLYAKYIKAGQLEQDSGSNLYINDQSMIECDKFYENQNQGTTFLNLADENGVAIIKTPKLIFNAPGPDSDNKILCDLFRTSGKAAALVIDTKTIETGNQDHSTDITSQVTFGDNANVYLASDEESKKFVVKATTCNPNGYNDDSSTPDKKPTLDLITSIDYDNHEHDISATCIQSYNGKMYMSYHTHGTGHGGCLEVFNPVQDNKVTLSQYLYDNDKDLDYNHLIINNGNLYTVGSSNKKGAMLAYIKLATGGLLETQEEQPLNILPLLKATSDNSGNDENCIAYDDAANRYIVMTTKGYTTYNATSLEEIASIEKQGKAKHIAIDGNKIATLVLDKKSSNADEAINATVEIFDKGGDLNQATKSFSVPAIQPNDGKNVLAIKNNKIYVCLGAAGIYCYDMDGNEQWHYQMPNPKNAADAYKAYANGCYVGDDGKVYVAYGSYGLVVLDNEGKAIAHRNTPKSANYVVEYNGYIYVAYGQSRLQVFMLQSVN